VPGELYPEIAVGGITNPDGADYEMAEEATAELRDGRTREHDGEPANDAIGYLIPKSEWDVSVPICMGPRKTPTARSCPPAPTRRASCTAR
jgi:hypothetical protein